MTLRSRQPFCCLGAISALIALTLATTSCRTPIKSTFDPYANAVNADFTQTQENPALPEELLAPPSTPFTLGPGDRIAIDIVEDVYGPSDTVVGPDGKIYYDLLPGLNVWGLSLEDVQTLLEVQLSTYLRSPTVSVNTTWIASKQVWLLGRLARPGVYPMRSPMTIIEAIATAGGLDVSQFTGTTEELADLDHSFVIRDGELIPVDFRQLIHFGDLSQNIYLQSGDYVYLPSTSSKEVMVLGAVNLPRSIGFRNQMTLVSAIANAEDVIEGAFLTQVAIIRGSLKEPSIAIVNFADIRKGKAPDVQLEPRDIVYVPFRPHQKLFDYANLIVDTFVRTVAANEGANAVSEQARPVGVNIGIGN